MRAILTTLGSRFFCSYLRQAQTELGIKYDGLVGHFVIGCEVALALAGQFPYLGGFVRQAGRILRAVFTGLLASSRDFFQVAQSLQRLHHQVHLLDAYAELARETKLPLVVHDRDAHREIVELLRVEGGVISEASSIVSPEITQPQRHF